MTRSIGILGGSFNPITLGHFAVANECLGYFDEVWITPCYKSVNQKPLVSGEHRVSMCKLACDNPRIKIFDYEIVNRLDIHPYDIWRQIISMHDEYDFYFIMGTDVANTISKWRHYPQILQEVKFAIVTRKGQPNTVDWRSPHKLLEVDIPDTSSTRWQECYRTDSLYFDTIDPKVADYIVKYRLYKDECRYSVCGP